MTLPYVDFIIEVYRDGYWIRFIPVGTTVPTLARVPDFVWYGQYKPGFSTPLDYPVITYALAYPQKPGK